MLVDFGSGAMSVGFADALDLTPAGRELLARVEAANQPPANVLRASIERLRYVISNPPDGDDGAWKSAMRAALREHEAALAAPPADASLSPRSRAMLAAGIESAKSEPIVDLGSFAPENVLRAMAVSYANAWINEGEDEDWEGHLYAVREALRECLSSGSPGYMPQRIADDYEARRAGARGMHDPPMGAS
jgi:hypothetical protein